MSEIIQHKDIVPESCLGKRFDQTIAIMFPDYSRSRLKDWIVAGQVRVNGKVLIIPREKMYGGEEIEINATVEAEIRFEAQNLPLNIVYEDEYGEKVIFPLFLKGVTSYFNTEPLTREEFEAHDCP